jgi:hypothetical protein
MMSPQERWDRSAQVLLWGGVLFLALTVYGVVEGDDLRGLIMTIAPGLIMLGLWRVACWRRDA